MKDIYDVLKSVFDQIKSLPTKRRAKVLAAGLVIAVLLLIGAAIGGFSAIRSVQDSEMAQTLARIQQAHKAELDAWQAQAARLDGIVSQLRAQLTAVPPTLTPVPTLTPSPVPTLTPTPTLPPTPTPTLAPKTRISNLTDGQSAPTNPEVVVEYNNIPADRHLWVAVRIPKVRPAGLIYPQLKEMKLPPHLVGTGIYHLFAALGGKEDAGAPFNIIVLLADQEANDLITAYARVCSNNVKLCTGMPMPETGVEILDFITVIRQ